MSSNSRLVYSTELGRTCPECGRPQALCICAQLKQQAAAPKGDGIVRVARETKGRKGKGVTLVKGLALDAAALADLAKQLKAACGSGGTVKDGVIEVQGDHVETVIARLTAAGHKVKRAGG
ncbi:MAG TPA: translation initiation factor Sui1 [Roseateles sp.]|nr:translation initiation factor Sui1 [Roseateles sp.]